MLGVRLFVSNCNVSSSAPDYIESCLMPVVSLQQISLALSLINDVNAVNYEMLRLLTIACPKRHV